MAREMESVDCNLCGADDPRVIYVGSDRLLKVPGKFILVQCNQCGLVYLNPRPSPEEIGKYYPNDYPPYIQAIENEGSWFRRLDRRYGLYKRCREITRQVGQPGMLLDIGCSTGIFLNGMRQWGWQVQGIELNSEIAEYARKRFDLQVFTGNLEHALFPGDSFDLVTLWDVLEHVYDPKSTLGEISRILRPGGWLVMSLPDLDSLEARLFGPYWAGLDMPRHLHVFNRQVLARLLQETGFTLEKRSYFTGRYGVLVLNVQFWSDERISNPNWRKFFMAIVRSLPVRLLSLPYYSVADRLGQSSIVTVFARKMRHV